MGKSEPECCICGKPADGVHDGALYCSRHLPPPWE